MKINWNKLTIDTEEYIIKDTVEKMTVPDCFVMSSNTIGTWHWEAKFYIGNDSESLRMFFWERWFSIACFLLKEDLIKYLDECKVEYTNPEQQYKKAKEMPKLWGERIVKVNELDNIIRFNLKEQTQIKGPRIYVNSDEENYKLIRELSLPNITYLSAIKLENAEGNIVYYFRLFVDYFWEEEHPYEIKQQELEVIVCHLKPL